MTVSTAQALHQVLRGALASDPQVILLGESVGRAGGIAGTTKGFLQTYGPERVLEFPIADRAMLGVALGLALAGKRPVVELTSTGRLLACTEVLAEAAAVAQAGSLAAGLVVRVPCGGQAGARIDAPVAELLAAIPGLQVVCGSSTERAAGLLRSALQCPGPVILLEPRTSYRNRGHNNSAAHPLGTASLVRPGSQVLLASWGSGVATALAAADQLAANHYSAAVLDLVSLSPLDAKALGEHLRAIGRLVLVNAPEGGLASHVLPTAIKQAFLYLESPLESVTTHLDQVVLAAKRAVDY